VGPDLFNPPPHRGWITLTPTVSIVAEYNDNIDLTGRDELEDFILSAVPGLTLSMQRPEYRLLAGYNFSIDYYADQTDLNGVANRQQGFVDGLYRVDPRLTLTFSERFVYDRNTNIVSVGGIASGSGESWRNTVTPGLQWQATPLTTLGASASYTIQRFSEDTSSQDSDTYRAAVNVDHRFTPRLTGGLEMAVAYIDFEDDPSATTYTPRVGLEYLFTPTLRGFIAGGPSYITREDGSDDINPAVTVGLEQTFRIGFLRAGYDRSFTAETIGPTDRQSAFASLGLTTLQRGFRFEVTPRYTHADESRPGDDRTVESLRVTLSASYQIARDIALIASYSFFAQREDRVDDIDQNRVFLGLQYAYPINFD
jgi:hypothetical protein